MATKSGGVGGFTYSIVAIAIIVLIVSTVAVPVVEDSQKSISSSANNTNLLFNYAVGPEIPDITIHVQNKTYYVNDEIVYSDLSDFNFIIVADNLVFRYLAVDNGYMAGYFNVSPYSFTSGDWSLIVSDGNATIMNGATSYDLGRISYLYYPDPSGDYGIAARNGDIFVDRDKTALLVSYMNANAGGEYRAPASFAEYKNGVITEIFNKSTTTQQPFTPADAVVTWNVTVIDDSDIRNQKLGTLSLDYSVGSQTGTNVETFYIVPIQYHYVSDSDETLINLFQVIPVLLFLVPVMFAVRMIQTRRN